MVNGPEECNRDYIECLSTLLTLSPVFSIPSEVQGSSVGIEEHRELQLRLTDGQSSATYLHGWPGVGKSAFSITLLRTLRRQNPESVPVAYYSFSQQDERRTSSTALMSSLICQILSQDPQRFEQIRDLYLAIKGRSIWTFEALWIFFQSLLASRKPGLVFCIINKIHNCDLSRTRFLSRLIDRRWSGHMSTSLRVILIGELRQDIQDSLKTCPNIQFNGGASLKRSIYAHVERFIAELMEKKPFLLEFEPDLKEKLYKCENFLQLSVTSNELMDRARFSNQEAVRSVLQVLPYGVSDRVTLKVQRLPGWASKALGWILHAQRPMEIKELAAAIALVEEEESLRFHKDKLPLNLSADMKHAFDPLVKVENNEVYWSHEQFKHCLSSATADEKRQLTDRTQSERLAQNGTRHLDHWSITRILLKYLSSKEFIDPMKEALKQEPWMIPQGPMFDLMAYAVHFWPAHYRKAKEQGWYSEVIIEYLKNGNLVRIWWELKSRLRSVDLPSDICISDPLLLAAHLGFADVVEVCLKAEMPKGVAVATKGTAIVLASWGGHLDIVTKLFDNGFDKETANDAHYLTEALINASNRGHEEITKFLIDHIPKPTGNFDWDPVLLCRAAEIGYETLVKMFIAAGAGVDVVHAGTTPLQFAAKNGNESIVECLLSHGAEVNSDEAEDSFKPLMHAANKGYTTVARLLMQYEVNARQSNAEGQTALHLAAQNGHQDTTELLLERGPDLAATDQMGRTALHLASLNGHAEIVKALVGSGPNPRIDTQDDGGDTALSLASKKGHLSAVKVLLESGARVNSTGRDHHTPLHGAALNGHEGTAEMILKRGSKLKTQFADIVEVLQEAARRGFLQVCKLCLQIADDEILNTESREQWTALHEAAQNGHDQIVTFLLDNRYNMKSEIEEGMTPLAVAAFAGQSNVVQVLLDRGANPLKKNSEGQTLVSQLADLQRENSLDSHVDTIQVLLKAGIAIDDMDRSGRSALHYAMRMGNLKIAKELLNSDANPNLQDYMHWTPLHTAASKDKEFSELLLENKADVQSRDEDGWTPFHVAAQNGRVDVMEVLWKAAPAVIRRSSKDGRTPLHFAGREIESMEWLLAHNLEVDAKDAFGETALMTAARSGSANVVGLLLSHKADPQLRDNFKKTALHRAAEGGSVSVAQSLLEKDISIIDYLDDKKWSALHIAIQNFNTDFARALVLRQPHININLQDKDGNTPLLLAIKKHEAFANFLIESGADTELRNKAGETALLVAVRDSDENLWKSLLDRPNGSKIDAGGGTYPTALHVAAAIGEGETVKQLVNRGANVNAVGGVYRTALQAAAASGFDDIVEYLLEKGADASVTGGLFSNALSAAMYSGTFEIVPKLNDRGAAINVQDGQGRTAIHLAAWRCSWDVIEWLKNRDSDLSVKDHQARTILHHAAMGGNHDVVARLLNDEGTRQLNVEDIDGWTPLHWACRSQGNKEVVQLLMNGINPRQPTRHGWTPESISIFHDAKSLLPIMSSAHAELDQSHYTDDSGVNEGSASPRNWITGSNHWNYECNGCGQKVS